jgi:hypothetical protein
MVVGCDGGSFAMARGGSAVPWHFECCILGDCVSCNVGPEVLYKTQQEMLYIFPPFEAREGVKGVSRQT